MLNLATQPFVNRRRFYVLSTATLVALSVSILALSGAFLHNFRSEQGMRRDLRQVRDELGVLEGRQKRIEAALELPQAAETLDRADFFNSLIRQKAVSWTRIFMDLEKIMPDRVQAISLRPVVRAKKDKLGTLQIGNGPLQMDLAMSVSAENVAGLLDLLHRMEKSSNFSDPVLQSDSPPNGSGANGANGGMSMPIAFQRGEGDRLYTLNLVVNYAQ